MLTSFGLAGSFEGPYAGFCKLIQLNSGILTIPKTKLGAMYFVWCFNSKRSRRFFDNNNPYPHELRWSGSLEVEFQLALRRSRGRRLYSAHIKGTTVNRRSGRLYGTKPCQRKPSDGLRLELKVKTKLIAAVMLWDALCSRVRTTWFFSFTLEDVLLTVFDVIEWQSQRVHNLIWKFCNLAKPRTDVPVLILRIL